MALSVEQLSPALGALITGVDLNQPLDDATFADIMDVWHENCVMVFRGHQLDDDGQIRFASRFGQLGSHQGPGAENDRDPRLMWIGNVDKGDEAAARASEGEFYFHSDMAYYEVTHKATFLYALQIPSHGGYTRFANLYKAFDAMPDDLRERLEGRKALHIYNYSLTEPLRLDEIEIAEHKHFWHPLFTTHPDTGRRVLFFSRLMTRRIEGLSDDENDEVLDLLIALTERPEFIYEHPWKIGDLTIWDNRCVNHGRTDFDSAENRLMRRCTVIGSRPQP